MSVYESPLDLGIKDYVETLAAAGVETFESCEGGESHTFPVPTIRFHGQRGEGFRPLAVALQHAYPVSNLRRVWSIERAGRAELGTDLLQAGYFPCALSSLQREHRRCPPVPLSRLEDSMLLPSVHWLLLWCTLVPVSLEWNGFTVMATVLPSRIRRAAWQGHATNDRLGAAPATAVAEAATQQEEQHNHDEQDGEHKPRTGLSDWLPSPCPEQAPRRRVRSLGGRPTAVR